MPSLFSFGEVLIDFLPTDNGDYSPCAGGAPANVSVGVAQLGGESSFVGGISTDAMGYRLRDELQRYHVNCNHTSSHENPTAMVLVALDADGERSFQFYRHNTADLAVDRSLIDELPIKAGDVVHVCSNLSMYLELHQLQQYLLERARECGAIVSVDVNLRPALWPSEQAMLKPILEACSLANVIKLSTEELETLAGLQGVTEAEFERLLVDQGVDILLITDGGNAVTAKLHDQQLTQATPKIQPIDTTGAGDAFTAGFWAYWLTQDETKALENHTLQTAEPLQAALKFAVNVGAAACLKKGAFRAMPTIEDINNTEAFVK